MLGQSNGVPVKASVPDGWVVWHHQGRQQPWTLRRMLAYDRHLEKYAVVRFCKSLGEAEVASGLALSGGSQIKRRLEVR